jgi:hypothetical protein
MAELMGTNIHEVIAGVNREIDSHVSVLLKAAEQLESAYRLAEAREIYGKIGDIYLSCNFFGLAGVYYKKAEKWESAGSSFMQSDDFMMAGKMFRAAGNSRMARKAYAMAARKAEKKDDICQARRAYHEIGRRKKVASLDARISAMAEKVEKAEKERAEERLRKKRLGLCK